MNPTVTEASTIVVPTQAPVESPMPTPVATPESSVFAPIMPNSGSELPSPGLPLGDATLPVQQSLQTETMPSLASMGVSPDFGTPTPSFPQAVDTNSVPLVPAQPDNGLSAIPTERTDGYVTPDSSTSAVSLPPTPEAVPAPLPEWKPPASITADVTPTAGISPATSDETPLTAISSQDKVLPLNDSPVMASQGVDMLRPTTEEHVDDSGHITNMISKEIAENDQKAAQLAADKEEGQKLLEFHNSDLGKKYRATLRKAGWRSSGDIVESTGATQQASSETSQGIEPTPISTPASQPQAA